MLMPTFVYDAMCCILIGGSLQQLFSNSKGLHPSVVDTYAKQLVKGVAYLHANRIIHRNLCGKLLT